MNRHDKLIHRRAMARALSSRRLPDAASSRASAIGALVVGVACLGLRAAQGSPQAIVALGIAGLVALLLGAPLARRFGPRHLVLVLLPVEALALAVLGLVPILALGPGVAVVDGLLLGTAAGLHACAERLLLHHEGRPRWKGLATPLLCGIGGWVAAGVDWIGPAVAAATLMASIGIQRIDDPLRPGPTPMAPYLPWRGPDGTRPPRLATPLWRRAPATMTYLLTTTLAFALFVARYHADSTQAPAAFVRFFVYQVPELAHRPDLVLLHLVTSVWINWHIVQVVYVIGLLLLAGIRFEAREGTPRTVAVFYATSMVAGLVAGALLLGLHGRVHAPWVERAWTEAWTGGSAGAFGLLGATAARARRPWLLLTTVAAWEFNVAVFFLRSYTPAFHLTALATGLVLARTVFRAPRPDPRRL